MTWNNMSGVLPDVSDAASDVAPDAATAAPAPHIRPLVDAALLPDAGEDAAVVQAAHRWYEHLIALWAPAVIEAAHDLGLFERIARAPLSSAQVADAIGADRRATRVLLEALYAYEVIERIVVDDADGATGADGASGAYGESSAREESGGVRYGLSHAAAQCLLGDGLYSLSGKIEYDRRLAWSAWRNFADAVRAGCHDASGGDRPNQIHAGQYGALVRGINFWAPPIIAVLAAELERRGWRADAAATLLDVGCGTGLYSQLLLRRFAGWSAVGIDVPSIAPLARTQAERLGVSGRFSTAVLDFQHDSWGEQFDLVFFANIFHLQTPVSARALLRKARAAMAGHGLIAIADQIIDEERHGQSTQNRFFRLFAASMLATGGGDSYTRRDYEAWLAEAGLRPVALLDTPMHRILLAEPDGVPNEPTERSGKAWAAPRVPEIGKIGEERR